MSRHRICIPTSDAVDGNIGEGVDGIFNMRRGKRSDIQALYNRLIGGSAPVVVAFTKSDLAFPHISGSESGHYQYQDRTRTRAYVQCEQLCRSLFRREARDRPSSSCVVRGFESISGYYHSSFNRVRLFLDSQSHLSYLFWFSGLDEAVSISTLRMSQ